MALLDIGNAWTADDSTDLFKKFLGSALKSAANILNEDAGATNHNNRVIWANALLSSDDASVKTRVRQLIRYGAATNATMQANPTALSDNDIDFIVASIINNFATGS